MTWDSIGRTLSTEKQSDTKVCFLGPAARDSVILSQPAALIVLLARKLNSSIESRLRIIFKEQRK